MAQTLAYHPDEVAGFSSIPPFGNGEGASTSSLSRKAFNRNHRGYFAIGIENAKSSCNVGTLWRSAFIFGAKFIFTIGRRIPKQASNTVKAWRHIPYFRYDTFEQFYDVLPYDCQLVGIEIDTNSKPIGSFNHPQRSVYLLGAEDSGLSKLATEKTQHLVQLPGNHCLNVSVAGSIVMYDRINKMGYFNNDPA